MLGYCFISNCRLAGLSVAPDFKQVVHRDLHDSADLVIISLFLYCYVNLIVSLKVLVKLLFLFMHLKDLNFIVFLPVICLFRVQFSTVSN